MISPRLHKIGLRKQFKCKRGIVLGLYRRFPCRVYRKTPPQWAGIVNADWQGTKKGWRVIASAFPSTRNRSNIEPILGRPRKDLGFEGCDSTILIFSLILSPFPRRHTVSTRTKGILSALAILSSHLSMISFSSEDGCLSLSLSAPLMMTARTNLR